MTIKWRRETGCDNMPSYQHDVGRFRLQIDACCGEGRLAMLIDTKDNRIIGRTTCTTLRDAKRELVAFARQEGIAV